MLLIYPFLLLQAIALHAKRDYLALGRVLGLSTEEEGCNRIVVDEILKSDVELLGGEKTFEDLTVGDVISRPKYRTVFG